jgi:hypothetical protein
LAPSMSHTGGPECLHQLFSVLYRFNIQVRMYYVNNNGSSTLELHPVYSIYSPIATKEIIDDEKNIVIVPETRTYYLKRFTKIRKCIWWLSIDNYLDTISFFSKLKMKVNLSKVFDPESVENRREISFHLAQSNYAYEWLSNYGIENVFELNDYLREDFVSKAKGLEFKKKRDIVLFNPKKGFEHTQRIIKLNPEIEFVPIINLSPSEVVELMLTSKVYIDFGHHPGRDKFPRESVLLGCCLITGLMGSANNEFDIRIPNSYKFREIDIDSVGSKIKEIFTHYEQSFQDFQNYREEIINGESIMLAQVKKIFGLNQ